MRGENSVSAACRRPSGLTAVRSKAPGFILGRMARLHNFASTTRAAALPGSPWNSLSGLVLRDRMPAPWVAITLRAVRSGIAEARRVRMSRCRCNTELQAELRQIPAAQMLFIAHGGKPCTVESFGNWFADQCDDAELPSRCRAHGLRKYGAIRLAERGASEWQIAAFLAHRDTREARRYVQAASRVKMAADGLAHLENVQRIGSLDKTNQQYAERK